MSEPESPPTPDPVSSADPAPAPSPTPAPEPAPAEPAQAKSAPASTLTPAELEQRPSYLFFGVVSSVALLLDLGSKAWAEIELSKRTLLDPSITLIENHLAFTLAYNKGGAWGLLHDASETVRRPFFLLVSVLAIAFIVSLYSRLAPGQRALKWGLPCVLGGALGNLSDRITRSSVVDFIDYRADWIESMNRFIAKYSKGWSITDHWPTFNVADVFICVGVGLMAVDMVTSRRKPKQAVVETAPAVAETAAPSETAPSGELGEAAASGEPGEGPSAAMDASAAAEALPVNGASEPGKPAATDASEPAEAAPESESAAVESDAARIKMG